MVQIQIDVHESVDKKLRIYMAYNNITSKAEAVNSALEEYFLIRPPKATFLETDKTIENSDSSDIAKELGIDDNKINKILKNTDK